EFVKEVEDIVMSYENIIGIHDFICHDYGPGRHIISLHAEVPAEQNLLSMHDTIDNIERTLSERLHCDTVIHMDPVMINDEKTCQLRDQVTSIVKSIDSSLSIHDFRIVEGPTHTNLIFDIVVPFDAKLKDEIVIEKVYQTIKELNAHYYPVMKIDHSHIM
ncbi:MAG: cation-efflux pump, partial [Christensenellaceae bacterium]|nr:cation-efflux pump [Christensenellaceae bacterium]